MKFGFQREPWRDLIPEVVGWIEKTTMNKATDVVQGGHHIAAVVVGDDEQFEVDCPAMAEGVRKKVAKAIAATGWKGAGVSPCVHLDGANFVLIAPVKIKTTAQQKGRQLGQDAAKAVKDLRVEHLVICKPKDLCPLKIYEGVCHTLYAAVGFKGKKVADKAKEGAKAKAGALPEKLSAIGGDFSAAEWTKAKEMSKAVAFTRLLQDAPANWLDPVRFGEIAAEVSKDAGAGVRCKIGTKQDLVTLGMGSFLSVSEGSEIEPRLITIEIDGVDNSRTVALIGKGLTFDAGGISLKPGAGMEEMKYDMSGGAAVLGAAMVLSKIKPPTRVVCIIGASENMPSGKATKPGDVVVAMNGKTIEVQNTDAEGRLVLADLLHYAAVTYSPVLMVDIATLTGAVLMALGSAGAAVMSNDQKTAEFLLKMANDTGEPLWQLPLWPELEKETKGETADLNNIAKSNVKAGSIIGGMFLKEFVGDRHWAHLDVAGTAYNSKATGFPSSGGAAYGVRLMVEACLMIEV